MFCENCGTKAKEGANFCEECGKPLNKPEIKPKKEKKPKKEISRKTKTIIIGGVCGLIIIVWLVLTIFSKFTPESVALDYFKAVSDNDASELYNYLNVENKDFTSKKVFKKVMKTEEDKNITNYAVASSNISTDGLEATVTIKYIVNGVKSNTTKVKLVKDKKNKMLIFDNWKVVSDTELVEDFQIKVMKDSKVELAGITLDEKYLDSDNSNDNVDVYKIPQMFEASYPVKVEYPMGIKIETTIKPSTYSKRTTLDFDLDDISKEDKETIEKTTLESIQYIYNSALEKKEFSDIKSKFISETEEVESTYSTFKESLGKRAEDLESITFTKVTLNKLTITDEGYLKVSFKVKYDYKKEEKESSSASSSITFDAKDEYKIVDFSNFKTYF